MRVWRNGIIILIIRYTSQKHNKVKKNTSVRISIVSYHGVFYKRDMHLLPSYLIRTFVIHIYFDIYIWCYGVNMCVYHTHIYIRTIWLIFDINIFYFIISYDFVYTLRMIYMIYIWLKSSNKYEYDD